MSDTDKKTAVPVDDRQSSSSDGELTDADKALAALGYAPVRTPKAATAIACSYDRLELILCASVGLQA